MNGFSLDIFIQNYILYQDLLKETIAMSMTDVSKNNIKNLAVTDYEASSCSSEVSVVIFNKYWILKNNIIHICNI